MSSLFDHVFDDVFLYHWIYFQFTNERCAVANKRWDYSAAAEPAAFVRAGGGDDDGGDRDEGTTWASP